MGTLPKGVNPGVGSARAVKHDALARQTGQRLLHDLLNPDGVLLALPAGVRGAVVGDGAVVEYAIIGENTVIGEGAHIGAPPDGTDAWGVATCGPDITIRAGAVVPASAMIYTSEEV